MIAFLLYCYVASWPIMKLIGVWKYEGTPAITIERILFLLLVPAILVRSLIKKERFSFGAPFYWLCSYIIWCIINSFINPIDSRIRVLQVLFDTFFTPFLVYFTIMNMKNRVNFRLMAASMVLSGLVIGGIGIAEFIAGRNLVGPLEPNPEWVVRLFRANGPFHDGLTYAAVLVAYIPFTYYFMRKRLLNNYFAFFSIAFLACGSLVNFSRNAALSMVIILFILASRNSVSRLLALWFTIGAGGIVYYLFYDVFRSSVIYKTRVADMRDVAGRWAMYLDEVKLITTNLFTGIGFGNYGKTHLLGAHNSYLLVLIEYGLFGFIFFVGFIASLALKNLRKAYRRKDSILLRVKFSYLFIVLFMPNTFSLLHAAPFMTAFMIIIATIDLHFDESYADIAAPSSVIQTVNISPVVGKRAAVRALP